MADAEDQLAILGVKKFDALSLHDPHEIEPTLEAGGALEGLERVRQQGAVDFIGYGMRPHDFHLAHIASGRTDAMLCFNDYNLLRQSAADAILPAAAVLNGWSIMRGWLTGVPVEHFIPRDKWGEDHQRAEAMRLWCSEQGIDMLELTLQFCLREERIDGNPIGSLNIEQLELSVLAAMGAVTDETIAAFRGAAL